MSVFNLYNEIEQELHFLLPKRETILIIFHLYHRMKWQEIERTSGKEVENSGAQVIKKQVNKLGDLFKQILQSAWDCLRFYTPVILANDLMTEPELNEIFDLFSPSSEEAQQLFSDQLI